MQNVEDISSQLKSQSPKNQLKLISDLLETGESGLKTIMEWLHSSREISQPTLAMGKAYQIIYEIDTPETKNFLATNFPTGIVPLQSSANIDYLPLQKLLIDRSFEKADLVTIQKMCELAGKSAIERKWLYFTEVENFPVTDLLTIDRLWTIHSEGKFGFSVQRKIWLSLGKDFTKLWPKIDWKNGNTWTRYPNGFTWDLKAPPGHLPLSNQLRGVRVISAIFSHPAWSND